MVEIEKTLDEAVKQMGSMTEDAFFHLENREFAKACEQCDYGPSQLAEQSEKDDRRTGDYTAAVGCFQVRFRHFYYAMTPKIPEIFCPSGMESEKSISVSIVMGQV